jgi:hypothetical protein
MLRSVLRTSLLYFTQFFIWTGFEKLMKFDVTPQRLCLINTNKTSLYWQQAYW